MFEFSLYNKHEFLGLWEDPENPENKVAGLLKYDPDDGITLELESSFKRQANQFICGVAGGMDITLVNCYAFKWNGSEFTFGITYRPSKMSAMQVFIGAKFRDFEKLNIEHCYFKTDSIKQWSRLSGFEELPLQIDSTTEINFKYTLPKPVLFFKDEGKSIDILTHFHVPASFPTSDDLSLIEYNFFKVSNIRGYDECNKHILNVTRFLSFSMRNNINVEAIMLRSDERMIHVLERRRPITLGFKANSVNLRTMFFSLTRHKDEISNLYASWVIFTDSCTDFINLYFDNPSNLLSDIFSRSVQSLEEIHRLNSQDHKMGFQRRIEDLFSKFEEVMGKVGDKKAFSKLLLDHRDYFTHWFEKKQPLILEGEKLHLLAKDANLLFELCLLKNIGLSTTKIIHTIMHCQDYQMYLYWPNNSSSEHHKRPIQWLNQGCSETQKLAI
jgi:hypothetical protein